MRKAIAIMLLLASLLPIPPAAVHGQAGGYWKVLYSEMYKTHTAPADVWPAIEDICSGNAVRAIAISANGGNIDFGQGGTPVGWYMRSIDGTAINTLASDYHTWTGHSRAPQQSLIGAVTQVLPSINTTIGELFVYCSGTGTSDSYSAIHDRYRWEEVAALSPFSQGDIESTNNSAVAAAACGDDSRPAGAMILNGDWSSDWRTRTWVGSWMQWQPAGNSYLMGLSIQDNFFPWETTNIWYLNAKSKFTDLTGITLTYLSNLTMVNMGIASPPSYLVANYRQTWQKTWVYCFDNDTEWGGTRGGDDFGVNILMDGGMEEYPLSSAWFPDTSTGAAKFGRISDSNLLTVGYGDPNCGNGFQVLSTTNRCAWSILEYYNTACQETFTPLIRQQFSWAGGKLYWSFAARGLPDGGWDRQVPVTMYISNKNTNQQTVLFDGMVPIGWETYSGSVANVAAGYYVLTIGKQQAGSMLYDAVVIDDVQVSPKLTYTASCVQPAEPTPGIGTPTKTATPTTTPTPPGMAGPNLLLNCGFEMGQIYWQWQNDKSYVIYGADNYSHGQNDAPSPAVSQLVNWPGGTAYVQFKTDSAYRVTFRSLSSGTVYLVSSDYHIYSGWITKQAVVNNLTAGAYYFELHHPSGYGPSEYDDLSVSTGNYGSCSEGTLHVTPTAAGATSTPYVTPTMFATATQRPTSTVPAGQPTSTARPTYTPFPTFTTMPTLPATITPTRLATYTPYPTYTSAPTYTPNPNYTPDNRGLPTEAPPPQPPPDYYTICERPQNGYDVAAWIEYDRCMVLSYFSMSPNAVSTMVALDNQFGDREPMGTLKEIEGAIKGIDGLLKRFEWSNGAPGTDDRPDITRFFYPGGDSPWNGGEFDFSPSTTTSMDCDMELTRALGAGLAQPICWFFNLLARLGVTPWLQLFVNMAAIGVLLLYFWKKWIDAGTGA